MFETLLAWNKQVTTLVGVFGAVAALCFGDASVALFFLSAIASVFMLVTVVLMKDGSSPAEKDPKTACVAMVTITTLTLFTLAIVLAGVPLLTVGILAAIIGAFAYVMARVAKSRDDRFSTATYFALFFPATCVVWMVARGRTLKT